VQGEADEGVGVDSGEGVGEGGVGEDGRWEDGRYCVIRERFLLVWVRLAFDGWIFWSFF
jgi:hypothetical protein